MKTVETPAVERLKRVLANQVKDKRILPRKGAKEPTESCSTCPYYRHSRGRPR